MKNPRFILDFGMAYGLYDPKTKLLAPFGPGYDLRIADRTWNQRAKDRDAARRILCWREKKLCVTRNRADGWTIKAINQTLKDNGIRKSTKA